MTKTLVDKVILMDMKMGWGGFVRGTWTFAASRRAMSWCLCLVATVVPALGSAQEVAEDSKPILRAQQLASEEVDLDGYLREGVWSTAEPITDFVQQEPVEGGEPSERTEIRVAFDEDALYIGAMLYDDPAGILAYQKRRDVGLGTDDRFMFIFDTFLDGRTGYFFEINPAGLMGDGLITGGGGGGRGGGGFGINKAWDGIWEARVQRLENGWSAEIRVPFGTLNFDPAATTWGINFQRTIRRRNEEILWSGHRRNQGLFRPIHAGRLEGLRDLSQGVGLEVKPYIVGGFTHTPDATPDPTNYSSDVGFDVGYSITPSLRAAASINTDFAEVEVDQRRVNLTRFPLRFPERRDFFLEGSGVFAFAGSNGVSPYFSRRIGLRGGEAVPIQYGTRLGGQAGDFELGLLQVGTGEQGGIGREDFTVARVKRRILSQSTIGAIYTRRAGGADSTGNSPEDQHTAGVDLDYRTSNLFGDKNFQFEAFLAWNSNPDPDVDRSTGDLTARGIRVNFPNDVWQGHVSYREFGEDYDPSVGFVTRNGFRRVEPRIGWRPRLALSWIRRLDFSTQFRYLEGLDTGTPEERQWRFNLLGVDFESGDNFDVTLTHQFEYLDNGFQISPGVDIGVGEYGNWQWEVRGRTAGRRRVSVNGEVRGGGFWNGDRFAYEAGLTFRPNPGVSVGTSFERNKVDLPQGAFNTNLMRLEGAWDISPWASITGNVQYDDRSEVMGLFMKSQWIVKPGNEFFVVYTQNWRSLGEDLFDREFSTLSRGGSVKLNYTVRF